VALWDNVWGCWLLNDDSLGPCQDSSPNGRHLNNIDGTAPYEDGLFGKAKTWDFSTKDYKLGYGLDPVDVSNGLTIAVWHRVITPAGWYRCPSAHFRNTLGIKFSDMAAAHMAALYLYGDGSPRLPHLITAYAYGYTGDYYSDYWRDFIEITDRWSLYVARFYNDRVRISVNTHLVVAGEADDEGIYYGSHNLGLVNINAAFRHYAHYAYTDPGKIQLNGLAIWSKILTEEQERAYYNRGHGVEYGQSGNSAVIALNAPYAFWDFNEKIDNEYYADYKEDRNRMRDATSGYAYWVQSPPITKMAEHSEQGFVGGAAKFPIEPRPVGSPAYPTPTNLCNRTIATGLYIPGKEKGITISFYAYFDSGFSDGENPPLAGLGVYFGDLGHNFEGYFGLTRGIGYVSGWEGPYPPLTDIFPDVYVSASGSPMVYPIRPSDYALAGGQDAQGVWRRYTVRINDQGTDIFIDGVKVASTNEFTRGGLFDGFYQISLVGNVPNPTIWPVIEYNDYSLIDQFTIWDGNLSDEDIANIDQLIPVSQSALPFEYNFNSVTMNINDPTPSPTQHGGPVNPHVMLQWSDDDGNTWSNERMMPLGRVGQYMKRMKWNRLGRSRNRVFRVSISDPVRVVLRDAFIDADEGAH
jgi:hypothetical protein